MIRQERIIETTLSREKKSEKATYVILQASAKKTLKFSVQNNENVSVATCCNHSRNTEDHLQSAHAFLFHFFFLASLLQILTNDFNLTLYLRNNEFETLD